MDVGNVCKSPIISVVWFVKILPEVNGLKG
jgi:hypothetical protein